MASQPPHDRTQFHSAIICALPREADAVTLLFDHFWDERRDPYRWADNDTNTYIAGRIGEHFVVHEPSSRAWVPTVGVSRQYWAILVLNLRLKFASRRKFESVAE
ncbi:uncharacterized protein B0I36DRAFT_435315 [Microdochium trichocladiopsis]|uniref:Uncharacterized protein n=1 Tax=Microdochium trichocladiopsis TaxID=1682393 RepID=A0A9P8XVW5_9PEZI|nr:uncharacterized protein B0I36DRAFT_435315 [Microdochium trichocladiopsis]KAH7021526.1 hypothetical protein B0I36DRAFT_435315 [Microdochium trichocladiopsis]